MSTTRSIRGQDPYCAKPLQYISVDISRTNPEQANPAPVMREVKAATVASKPLAAVSVMPVNSHDGAMQHEARYLNELFIWFDRLDLLVQNDQRHLKIKEYSLWLSLVRLFNSMNLRFETNPQCMH